MKKNDQFYEQLVKRMGEAAIVEPQTVGPFTSLYKRMTPLVKVRPLKTLMAVSLLSSLLMYLILGSLIVRIVSLLQFGF